MNKKWYLFGLVFMGMSAIANGPQPLDEGDFLKKALANQEYWEIEATKKMISYCVEQIKDKTIYIPVVALTTISWLMLPNNKQTN